MVMPPGGGVAAGSKGRGLTVTCCLETGSHGVSLVYKSLVWVQGKRHFSIESTRKESDDNQGSQNVRNMR